MAIDKLVGNGRILNGEALVADVRYEVRVEQQSEEDRLSGLSQRPPECDLFGLTKPLATHTLFTLVMNDGRKLDFYSYGPDDIRPTGPIRSRIA
jgi:hypothetical protein